MIISYIIIHSIVISSQLTKIIHSMIGQGIGRFEIIENYSHLFRKLGKGHAAIVHTLQPITFMIILVLQCFMSHASDVIL